MASSLFDALAAGAPEKKQEIENAMSGDFAKKVDGYKNMIVDAFMKNNINVNKGIARIAEKENLNDEQINRIVEEVNNQLYLLKYNQMKNSPEREVDFDIADLKKIREIVKSGEANKPINQQKEASTIISAFEKKASWESEDGDSLNFLNSSSYEFGNLNADVQQDRKEHLAKIASEKIALMEEEANAEMKKFAEEIYDIAGALIKYDRANVNVQPIFEQMCKQADIRKSEQIFIKEAITQKIAQFKEYRVVPDEYDFNVDFVDIDKVANEFSLGKHSFMEKMATDKGSNQNVPIVVTDKKSVRSVNHLISMAADAMKQKQTAENSKMKLDEVKNKIDKK